MKQKRFLNIRTAKRTSEHFCYSTSAKAEQTQHAPPFCWVCFIYGLGSIWPFPCWDQKN